MSLLTIHPIPILLVEDNLHDVELTKLALRQGNILNPIYVVYDGQEALDFLRHEGAYRERERAPRPGLILLDINLPKKDGHEVLRTLKTDEELRDIPVIMLTVSQRDEDIIKSYQWGGSVYIQKPVDFRNLLDIITGLSNYGIYITDTRD